MGRYEGPGGDVVLESGYKEIGDLAFWRCHNLISITLPESIRKIGTRAFHDCTSLTSINIPAKATPGSMAFVGTLWLKNLGERAVLKGILMGYYGPGGSIEVPENVKIVDICVLRIGMI